VEVVNGRGKKFLLKDLESKNTRQKKAVGDLMVDRLIPKEVADRKFEPNDPARGNGLRESATPVVRMPHPPDSRHAPLDRSLRPGAEAGWGPQRAVSL